MSQDGIVLSQEQEAAVAEIGAWLDGYDGSRRVFHLSGPAGSGKTTLVRSVVERRPGALLAAFSGKAAYVLGEKVGRPAQTLHSAIYYPDPCPGPVRGADLCVHRCDYEHVSFGVNHQHGALADAGFLVVDECSMVSDEMGLDVLSFGKPVLAIGDPFQLPPVDGCGFFTSGQPDVLLTEVHRQRDGIEVLLLATAIRLGVDYSTSPVFADDETVLDEFEPDIVICGTNATRTQANRLMRAYHEYDAELPEPGEKLICLQNSAELGLLNGQMLDVIETKARFDEMYAASLVDPLTGQQYRVPALTSDLTVRSTSLRHTPDIARLTYGYAITCHKAQGSEWDRVLLINDWRWEDKDRWLCTAVTRASKDLRIVRNIPYPSAWLD